jgi:nitrogen regulatory protein P-II 1
MSLSFSRRPAIPIKAFKTKDFKVARLLHYFWNKERRHSMTKKIEAIIREDALQGVKDGLRDIGIFGLNIFEVRGHGRQGGVDQSWRGATSKMDLIPKIQINIILSDHNVEKTIEAIVKACRTGKAGDGIIFVYPVEDVVRIRTGERGHDALMYPDDIDARQAKK